MKYNTTSLISTCVAYNGVNFMWQNCIYLKSLITTSWFHMQNRYYCQVKQNMLHKIIITSKHARVLIFVKDIVVTNWHNQFPNVHYLNLRKDSIQIMFFYLIFDIALSILLVKRRYIAVSVLSTLDIALSNVTRYLTQHISRGDSVSYFNSLWPGDAVCWQRSGSTLARAMAWCQMAPIH